jgi:transcriptional regulator with XRE-family HTH domain
MSMSNTPTLSFEVDTDRLVLLLDSERERRGITWSTLARQIGMTPNGLSQIKTGKSRPGANVLVSILMWINPVNPGAVLQTVTKTANVTARDFFLNAGK